MRRALFAVADQDGSSERPRQRQRRQHHEDPLEGSQGHPLGWSEFRVKLLKEFGPQLREVAFRQQHGRQRRQTRICGVVVFARLALGNLSHTAVAEFAWSVRACPNLGVKDLELDPLQNVGGNAARVIHQALGLSDSDFHYAQVPLWHRTRGRIMTDVPFLLPHSRQDLKNGFQWI